MYISWKAEKRDNNVDTKNEVAVLKDIMLPNFSKIEQAAYEI